MAYQTFDVTTARARQGDGWSYLDVRTPEEFALGHPEGAMNVPITFAGGVLNDRFVDVVRRHWPADTKLLVGCRSGARSARACEMLERVGFTSLANVAGGMLDWEARSLPSASDGRSWADLKD